MSKGAHVAVRRRQPVAGLRKDCASNRYRFLTTPGITTAENFSLPVELGLDAVFQLPHHHHVIQQRSSEIEIDLRGGKCGS